MKLVGSFKIGALAVLFALSMGAQGASLLPSGGALPTVDLDFGEINGRADTGPDATPTGALGVLTFELTQTVSSASVTIDPRPPLPTLGSEPNFEYRWFSIGAGDVLTALGAAKLSLDNGLIEDTMLSLGPGLYAFIIAAVDGGVPLVQFDGASVVVPIPAALWLFGAALLGMFGVRKRFNLAV